MHQNAVPKLTDGDILVPDTNVVLHQLDVLQDPKIDNVVLLSTVLDEVCVCVLCVCVPCFIHVHCTS